jgi:hypothetical protein
MTKTYQSRNSLKLTTSVFMVKDGKRSPVTISFNGGFMTPHRRNGIFSTSSEALQEAIESDSGYGSNFILIDSDGNHVVEKEKTKKQENQKKAPTTTKDPADPESTIVEDVKNFQGAKAYLLKLEGITPEMVKNKIELLKVAKEKKIIFKNVK